MLLSHVSDNCLIKIISGYLDRCADYRTTEWDNCYIWCTASDIYYHISAWLWNINTCTDCSCDWLLDNLNISGSCCKCSILNGLLLNLCNTTWHTYAHERLSEALLTKRLLDEVLDHLLCNCIIWDNTLTQRPDCNDITRCPSEHEACFLSDCLNLVGISVKCYYGRFF